MRHVEGVEACCGSRRVEANLGVLRRVKANRWEARRVQVLKQIEPFEVRLIVLSINGGLWRGYVSFRVVVRLALARGALRRVEAILRCEAF